MLKETFPIPLAESNPRPPSESREAREAPPQAGWEIAHEYLVSLREKTTMESLRRMLILAIEEYRSSHPSGIEEPAPEDVADRLIAKGMKKIVDGLRPETKTENAAKLFYAEIARSVAGILEAN